MNIFERIIIYLLGYSCWLSWQISKFNIKKYFFDMFNPGTEAYKDWIDVFRFIIGIACMFFIWAIIYHLMK